MTSLKDLSKPKEFWEYFKTITTIPRCTKNEEAIRNFIKEKCESFGYQTKIDGPGNLLAFPSSEINNQKKTVIFQSHMDMVCEKNKGVDHDFSKDRLDLDIIEEENEKWVTAKGTTLGADNGVGIAYSLALLETLSENEILNDDLAIKFLFTVEEEKGLTGAFNIDASFLKGDYLINLDSEEDDTFTIGCAGGTNTIGKIKLNDEDIEKFSSDLKAVHLSIKGLKGGHSGTDIHKGRANAIKILAKILWKINHKYNIHLSYIMGGNLPNAIPREAEAIFYGDDGEIDSIFDLLTHIKSEIELGISKIEPNMKIEFVTAKNGNSKKIFTKTITNKLLHILYIIPNGPVSYHPDNRDLVYTSTNLGSIRTESDILEIVTMQRSLHEISKKIIQEKIVALFELSNLEIQIEESSGYPGWIPNFESKLLEIAKISYLNIFDHEPHIQTIHAGLETGILKEKVAEIEMISLGPDIKDGHSPNERLKISSVEKIWNLLNELLKNINNP